MGEKRTIGKKAQSATGKKNALAMKKAGKGIFAPKKLSDALAAVCGAKTLPRTEVTKKVWVYIKKHSLNNGRTIKPDATLKAIFPVPSPWRSPGRLAEEFRRRAGLSSRD